MTIIRKKVRKMQCGGTYKMSVEVGDDHEGKNKTKWGKRNERNLERKSKENLNASSF